MEKVNNIFKLICAPFNWLFASLSGTDGKASGKKLTACFFTIITGYFLYRGKVKDLYSLYAFFAMLVTVLLMWGIITYANIKNLAQIIKDNNSNKDTDK